MRLRLGFLKRAIRIFEIDQNFSFTSLKKVEAIFGRLRQKERVHLLVLNKTVLYNKEAATKEMKKI